jgi:ketosteroid isomerase-like protein
VASHRRQIDEFYRRMNTLDLTVTEMCTSDVEWHWPPTVPGAKLFRGREEMLAGLATWTESWGELRFDVDETIEEGDWVFVMVSYRMRGAGSGLALEQPLAHLHQFSDGLIRNWWMFGDADKARRRFLAGDRPG